VAAAVALAGCGRKGALEPPPSAAIAQPAAAGQQPETGDEDKPVAPRGQKKRIPLDWLVD
jgi:predicted small lipoprotein YifL